MNSKKINQIILLVILMGLFNPLNSYQISRAQRSESLDLTQSNPNIVINSIILSNSLPEEAEEIIATITIENRDSLNYSNLLIQLTLVSEGSGHDDDSGDDLKVGTKIIQLLGPQEVIEFDILFNAPAGQYAVTAVVVFNNLPIPGSQKSVPIQILTPKVGDNKTTILAILVLIIFFLIILLGQATLDAIKLKNVNLHSNGK